MQVITLKEQVGPCDVVLKLQAQSLEKQKGVGSETKGELVDARWRGGITSAIDG